MTAFPDWLLFPSIEAVVLFGSKSRGDAKSDSDTDLAVFAHVGGYTPLVQVKEAIADKIVDQTTNLSLYSTATARRMTEDGSLFLWHLKSEGNVLFDRNRWFESLLGNLVPYSREKAHRDLNTFESVLFDICDALVRDSSTLVFEGATLYSILRSLGMIITTLTGNPCFGRVEPIWRTKKLMGSEFPFNDKEINQLLQTRLTYSRKWTLQLPDLSPEACLLEAEKTQRVLLFAREVANG